MKVLRIAALGLVAFAPGLRAQGTEEAIRKALGERVPEVVVKSIRKMPQMDIYEVVTDGLKIFYTDATGEFALSGNVFDLRTRTNLTDARRQELSVVDFSSLPLDKAIVRVKGTGARKLAVFTDPDCPFCKRLEAELANVSDVTLYLFLYPIQALHPDAPRKARAVWCSADQVKAWDQLMVEGKEPPAAASECQDPIAEIADLARKSHVEGTPGLIFGNGTLVKGAIPAQQIEELLARPDKS